MTRRACRSTACSMTLAGEVSALLRQTEYRFRRVTWRRKSWSWAFSMLAVVHLSFRYIHKRAGRKGKSIQMLRKHLTCRSPHIIQIRIPQI